MKKKRKLKKKFIVFFSLYFAFFTSFFIYKSFSKYSTNINKTANVAVAKWDVSANLPDANYSLVADSDEELYTLTVTNNSDVALTYSIVISNLPYGMLIALDNNSYKGNGNSTSITFNNVATISSDSQNKTRTHTLKIKADIDAREVSNKNVKIRVDFVQKQQ